MLTRQARKPREEGESQPNPRVCPHFLSVVGAAVTSHERSGGRSLSELPSKDNEWQYDMSIQP